jgi:hypothetical protein
MGGMEAGVKPWIAPLTTAGTIVGVVVIAFGVLEFVRSGYAPGLVIALAILIVGPGEDLGQAYVRRTAPSPEEGEARATVIDRVTSLAFLLLLGLAIELGRRG